MKKAFRYNRQGRGRPPRLFARWLGVYLRALSGLLRGKGLSGRALWTEDAAAELLAAGFPSLLAVPEPLFAETAARLPGRARLCASLPEEALLAQLRRVEERFGSRFDWDAFLAACEREARRGRRLRALADAIGALAPPQIDTRTPYAALRSLSERNRKT